MASYLDSSGVTYIFDVINNQWWSSKEATLPKTSFIIGDGQNSSVQKGALGVKSFGVSSVAAGKHSIAQGDYSFSMGEGNLSMGNKSVSIGGSFGECYFSGEANSTSYFTDILNDYKEIVGAHVYMNETDDEYSAIITSVSEGENGLIVELDKTLSDEGLVDQPVYISANIARGESSFTHGANMVSGNLDFVTGTGNLSAGYGNFIAGEDNSINGALNTVFGAGNHFIGENNFTNYIFGGSNLVMPYPTDENGESSGDVFVNFVVGENNMVSGEGNKIFGYNNIIDTAEWDCWNNFVVGSLNKVCGDLNFVAGEGNIIKGAFITTFGEQNETLLTMGTPLNGFMAGHNLQVQNDDVEIALGKWNKSNIADSESGRTLLSIGAGNEEERSNALEVMQNGDIYLGGHGSIYKLWDHKNQKTDFVTDLKTIEGNILEGVGDIDLESVTFKGFVDVESGTQGIDELAKSMRVGDVAMCMGTNATGGFGGKLSPDFFRIADYTDEDLEKFRSENLLPLYFATEFAYMEGANNILSRLVGAPSDEISGEMNYENLSTLSPMDVILVAKMDLNDVLGGGEEVPIEYEDVNGFVQFDEVNTLDHFKRIVESNGESSDDLELPPHFPEYMYVQNNETSTPVGVGAFRYTYNISTPNIVDDLLGESVTDKDYIVRTVYDKRGRALQSIAVNIGEVKADPNSYGFNNYSSSSTISFGLTSGTIADLNDPESVPEDIHSISFSFVSRNDLIAINDSVNSLPTEIPDPNSQPDGLSDPDMIYNPIYHEQPVLIKSMNKPLETTIVYQTVKLPEYIEQTGPAIFERINSGSLFQELTGEEIPDDLNSILPKFIYIQTPDTYTHILNESTLSDWIGLETTDALNMDDYIALSISRLDISKKPYMTQFIKIEDAEKYGFISYFEDDVKGHYLSDELIEKLYFDYNFLGGDAQVAINLAYIKSSEAVILDSQQETNFEGETYELYFGAIGETPAIHTEVYYKYLKPTASSLATEIPVLFCKIIRTNILEIFNYLSIAGDVLKALFGGSEGSGSDTEVIFNVIESVLSFIGILMGLGVGEFLTSGSFMYMDDILDIVDEFMEDVDNGNLTPPSSNSGDGIAGMIAEIMQILNYFAPRLIKRIPKKIGNNIAISGMNGVVEMIQVAMSLNNVIPPSEMDELMDQIMNGSFTGEVSSDEARDFLINGLPYFMQNEVYPLVSKAYGLGYVIDHYKPLIDEWCDSLDQNFIEYIDMMDSDNHTNGVDPVDVCNQMRYSGDGKIIFNDGYVGYNQDFEFKGFRNGYEMYDNLHIITDIHDTILGMGIENVEDIYEYLTSSLSYLIACIHAIGDNNPIMYKYPVRIYLYLIIHALSTYMDYMDTFTSLMSRWINKMTNSFPLIVINNPNGAGMIMSDQWTLDLLEKYFSPIAPDSEAILSLWQSSERLPVSDIINIIYQSIYDESLVLTVMAVSPYTMTARMDPNQSLSENIYSFLYELIKFGAADLIALLESEMNMVNAQQEANFVKFSVFLIENGEVYESDEVGDFEINREIFIKNSYEFEQLISQSNKNIQPIALEYMLEYPQGEMVTVANAWTENKLLSELPIFETNEETGENNWGELNILNNLEIDLDVIKSLPTLSSSYTISLPTLNDERIIDININIDENSNISNMVLHSDLLSAPLDGEEILYKDENGEFVLSDKIINTLNYILSCNKSIYLGVYNQETGEHVTEEDMSVLDNIFKVTIAHELDPKLYIKGVSGWNEVASSYEPTPVEDILDIL